MKNENQREVENLLPLIQLGDIEARNKVVELYLNLVRKINERFGGTDDGFQEGVLGLIKALENYDPNKSQFTTYSYKYIYHAIQNHFKGASNEVQLIENILIENENVDVLNIELIIEKYCTQEEKMILKSIYKENLNYTSAAKKLGIPRGELKEKLFITLRKIKGKL